LDRDEGYLALRQGLERFGHLCLVLVEQGQLYSNAWPDTPISIFLGCYTDIYVPNEETALPFDFRSGLMYGPFGSTNVEPS
jgi:hypothetical protein